MSEVTTNGRRKQTDLSKLDEMIEVMESAVLEDTHYSLQVRDASQILVYLNYLRDKTENNRLYHKKQNVKRNLLLKSVQSQLSADELAEIDRQADIQIGARHPLED